MAVEDVRGYSLSRALVGMDTLKAKRSKIRCFESVHSNERLKNAVAFADPQQPHSLNGFPKGPMHYSGPLAAGGEFDS